MPAEGEGRGLAGASADGPGTSRSWRRTVARCLVWFLCSCAPAVCLLVVGLAVTHSLVGALLGFGAGFLASLLLVALLLGVGVLRDRRACGEEVS